MSTSGSFNFTVSRDNLISDALQYIGALGEGESLTSTQQTEGARLLNMLAKLRAADGMPLWAIKRGTILPFTGASSIATNSHVVTFYDSTTLAADAVSSATALTISAAGTIADSDNIGIELDNGDMFWTTVSAGGGTTSLTIASGLTSAAGSGNRVYAYTASTDRIQRPLFIYEANMLQVTDNTSWSLRLVSRDEYFSLGSRTSEGVPNQLYFDSILGTDVADPTSASTWYSNFYVYPRFVDGKKVIEFSYQRPLEDFDSSTDIPDFPQEFYLPLMIELAALMGPKHGVSIEERLALRAEAQYYLNQALGTIMPEGTLKLIPDTSMQ